MKITKTYKSAFAGNKLRADSTHLKLYLCIYKFSFKAYLANLAHNSACISNSVSSLVLASHPYKILKHFSMSSCDVYLFEVF